MEVCVPRACVMRVSLEFPGPSVLLTACARVNTGPEPEAPHRVKGFVPTPPSVVDLMVEKLLRRHTASSNAAILDPGCGKGAFIDGIIRWCATHDQPLPSIVGIESDPKHSEVASDRFKGLGQIQIRHCDFLSPSSERFDYIIGNPPYVPITALTTAEREHYRQGYTTARGRFDLYLLFFQQALSLLKPGGRLVFITPEKFLYVGSAGPLRDLLSSFHLDELHFLDEDTFGELVTYPLVSTVSACVSSRPTRVIHRDGRENSVRLSGGASSWLPAVLGADDRSGELSLADLCTRVSCGVATGADSVFVVRDAQLEPELRPFAHPTISGRQIVPGRPLRPLHSLLVPYAPDGQLILEDKLGELGRYLSATTRRERLLARTCVARKPWYAFHETPPLAELARPKLLCKDIGATPFFVVDRTGRAIPRHSVYYILPANPDHLEPLARFLNSPPAQQWLRDHCQRAASGFLRLQSHVLKKLPVPQLTHLKPMPEIDDLVYAERSA